MSKIRSFYYDTGVQDKERKYSLPNSLRKKENKTNMYSYVKHLNANLFKIKSKSVIFSNFFFLNSAIRIVFSWERPIPLQYAVTRTYPRDITITCYNRVPSHVVVNQCRGQNPRAQLLYNGLAIRIGRLKRYIKILSMQYVYVEHNNAVCEKFLIKIYTRTTKLYFFKLTIIKKKKRKRRNVLSFILKHDVILSSLNK